MIATTNLEFGFIESPARGRAQFQGSLAEQLRNFREFGSTTKELVTNAKTFQGAGLAVDTFVNEFWTARQCAANALHEVSYRACFKPQLPRFFIERLTEAGDVVYDPFMGRGTTLVEAALLGRIAYGCDINPVSAMLARPRLHPPAASVVEQRLSQIDLSGAVEAPEELLTFYHPDTLQQICALRAYLLERRATGTADHVDDWIGMVALNRLTGHSPGFFSVYTLPPNQAVSVVSQQKINEKRKQTPPLRDVRSIILKKSRALLQECPPALEDKLAALAAKSRVVTGRSSEASEIPAESVSLVVTSPPFLDVVDYKTDNWLRCWFAGVDATRVEVTTPRKLEAWQESMTAVFRDLFRVLKPGGHVAFEVGEVRGGKIKLEEAVAPCGVAAGLRPLLILINDQKFTKTANCWGVDNNGKGTNTNRIVVFQKG